MSRPKKKESTTSTPSSPAPKPPVVQPTASFWRRWWKPAVITVGALLVLTFAFAGVAYAVGNRGMVRSTTIGQVNVGGLNSTDALTKIEAKWTAYSSQQITFTIGSQTITIDPVVVQDSAAGLVTNVVLFDPIDSVNAAAAFGHTGSWWTQLRQRVSGLIGRPHEFGQFIFDTAAVESTLAQKTADSADNSVDAAITIATDGKPTVTASKSGQAADVHEAASSAARQAATFSTAPIVVNTKSVAPTFADTPEMANIAAPGTAAVQGRAPVALKLSDKTWTIDLKQLNNLLGFRHDAQQKIKVGFDRAKTIAYLESKRSEIDIKPSEARFEMVNGRVKAFSTSQTGRTLDTAATWNRLNDALDQPSASIDMVVTETKPVSESLADTNNLGIKELVAVGTTSFAGSPVNRRFNLSLGAQKLNGLLIQPDETFSLIKALGQIDAEHGWKSELVIKPGGVIKPEYGGGLCQVGTTMFRVALNAGLPIVERKNHSLRISYYEPPVGLDATIYDPKPDFRFTNDYANPLLLQTEVSGNNLTFRFYGTKDGRTVDLPTPKVYNRTGIPATKTIEVSDLKPGVKVCQTPGHPGADATATYTVTKADGTKKTQVFQSHYMAIGVICRVGKKAESKPKTTNSNSNTNKSTNTNAAANVNATTNTNTPTNTNNP